MTEYEVTTSSIIGLFNSIVERYPNDKILRARVQNLAKYSLQLGAIVSFDPENYKRLVEELRKDRAT